MEWICLVIGFLLGCVLTQAFAGKKCECSSTSHALTIAVQVLSDRVRDSLMKLKVEVEDNTSSMEIFSDVMRDYVNALTDDGDSDESED